MASATAKPPASKRPASSPTASSLAARTLAGLSMLCAAGGGLTFIAAVLATQGAWYAGYVSEAGVAGEPYRPEYRLGLFGLAVALVLLAGAVRPVAVLPALVLLVSGLLAGISGSVSCSAGCPLPPYEPSTAADLTHAGAAVAAVGLCALAILLLAIWGPDSELRTVSRVAVGPVIVTGLANAYGIAFVGRSYLTGVAERVMLLLIIAWCLAAGLSLGRSRRSAADG